MPFLKFKEDSIGYLDIISYRDSEEEQKHSGEILMFYHIDQNAWCTRYEHNLYRNIPIDQPYRPNAIDPIFSVCDKIDYVGIFPEILGSIGGN